MSLRWIAGLIIFVFSVTVVSLLAVSGDENPHGNLQWDCQSCHTAEGWDKIREQPDFDHADTGFPLIGAHEGNDCMSCHENLQFAAIGIACADCHSDVHRGQLGFDCESCHAPVSWADQQDVFQQHAGRGFPLTGVHAVVDCQACHTGDQQVEFAGLSADCQSCHVSDFQATTNPAHPAANFSLDCESCHRQSTITWQGAEFDHDAIFQLNGGHQTLDCNSCHQQTFVSTPNTCNGCHNQDYQATSDPAHAEFGFPTDCQACHNERQWSDAIFDHIASGGIELRGAHQEILCIDCHVNNQLAGIPRDCIGCHNQDYQQVSDPNHVTASFSTNCLDCHSETAWDPSTFDHNNTGFALMGAHIGQDCSSCHTNGQFAGTPSDCYSCHQNDYENVSDPNHVAASFSTNCLDCHSQDTWDPSTFDHNNTGFALMGAHIGQDCSSCHTNGQFAGTPSDCNSCHNDDYVAVSDPNHVALSFPLTCMDCHSQDAWQPAAFDHSFANFALTGAHVSVDCASCHVNGQYAGTPTDCNSCHNDDYVAVADPNHVALSFPITCMDCHSQDAWEPASFDHSFANFDLVGAHISVDCSSCHVNGQYAGTPSDCNSCHNDDYVAVADPNHVALSFPLTCMDCHNQDAWEPSTFDHNNTGFALMGAHIGQDCASCHINGQYAGTPTDCNSCHNDDYVAVVDPNHVALSFPLTCMDCHSQDAWEPASFDHSFANFDLVGAHISVNCNSCHVNGQYAGTPTDCNSCHNDDYVAVTDPNHVALSFPLACLDCHSQTAWVPATFDHNLTNFALVGAHVSVNCNSCHVNGQYAGTPTDCNSCHNDDYTATLNPDHVAANFSLACETCHSTTAWIPATFDHGTTNFALTGEHLNVDCASCHVNGQYAGTPTDCNSCHNDDYAATTNPSHIAAGFPITCETCHETTGWVPANWDHDGQYFPIYSGKHKEEWNDCIDCHVNAGNFAVFECIFCHEHNRIDTDDDHDQVTGYVYQSTACLNCHPDGEKKALLPPFLDRTRN